MSLVFNLVLLGEFGNKSIYAFVGFILAHWPSVCYIRIKWLPCDPTSLQKRTYFPLDWLMLSTTYQPELYLVKLDLTGTTRAGLERADQGQVVDFFLLKNRGLVGCWA